MRALKSRGYLEHIEELFWKFALWTQMCSFPGTPPNSQKMGGHTSASEPETTATIYLSRHTAKYNQTVSERTAATESEVVDTQKNLLNIM